MIHTIDDIAPYEGPHALPSIRFRAVRQAIGVNSWGMSVMDLDPHCTDYPAHHHADEDHEEVYLVLRGAVTLIVDGHEHALAEGQLARVAPAATRKLVTGEVGARVLALGGTPGKAYAPSMGTAEE